MWVSEQEQYMLGNQSSEQLPLPWYYVRNDAVSTIKDKDEDKDMR
jgi:hypothetical protein